MVEFSWPRKRNFWKPPSGGSLLKIWWLWVYWPRRMVALEGQHRALVTKAFSKVVPFSIRDLRLGMCLRVLGFKSRTARSSARIKTMLGCLGGLSLYSLGTFPWVAGKQAESMKQVASSKRVGKGSTRLRPTRTPRARPVLTGIVKSPLWFGILEG